MQSKSTLETWLEDDAAVRERLGAVGVADREDLRSNTGLQFLQKMVDGELPRAPIGNLMGFVLIEVENGRVLFQGTPGAEHYNPSGSVHGGYGATLLDSAVGCAVHSTLPAGMGYTTLELKVNYVRAMNDRTGPIRAEGKVIQAGRQIAIAEGRITDANGKLYATATTTCLIFPI